MNILIIIGSAPCVHDDLIAIHLIPCPLAPLLPDPSALPGCRLCPLSGACFTYMALGDKMVHLLPFRIEYVATYHPTEIPKIKELRESGGGNTDYKVISHEQRPDVDIFEPFRPPSGSSALLGTLAAIRLGYNRIILCGCPLTGINEIDKSNYETFRAGWTALKKEVHNKVRSMSGWTRELLGEPSEEWLQEVKSE